MFFLLFFNLTILFSVLQLLDSFPSLCFPISIDSQIIQQFSHLSYVFSFSTSHFLNTLKSLVTGPIQLLLDTVPFGQLTLKVSSVTLTPFPHQYIQHLQHLLQSSYVYSQNCPRTHRQNGTDLRTELISMVFTFLCIHF